MEWGGGGRYDGEGTNSVEGDASLVQFFLSPVCEESQWYS